MTIDSSRRALACPRAGFPIRIPPACRGCTPLAGAFRRVPRPSSARHAKAFPVCLSSFSYSPLVTETSVFARFLLPYVVVNVPWLSFPHQFCPACPPGPSENARFSPRPVRQSLLNKTARTFLPSRVPLPTYYVCFSSLCGSRALGYPCYQAFSLLPVAVFFRALRQSYPRLARLSSMAAP